MNFKIICPQINLFYIFTFHKYFKVPSCGSVAHGWVVGDWVSGRMGGWTDGWTDGRMDGWVDEWTDGQVDGQVDG